MRAAMYSLLKFITLAVVLLNIIDFSHQLERREKRAYYEDDGDDFDDGDDDEDYDWRRQMAVAYQRSQGYFQQPQYRPLSRRQLARGQEAQAAMRSARQRMMQAAPLASNRRYKREAAPKDHPNTQDQRAHDLPAMREMMPQHSHILPKHMPMEAAEQKNHKPKSLASAEQRNHKGRPMSYEDFKKRHPLGRLWSGPSGASREPYPGYWARVMGDAQWIYGNNTDDPNWMDYGQGPWYGNNTDDPNWVDYFRDGYAYYGDNREDPNWVDTFGGFKYGHNEEDPTWVDPYPQWWRKFTAAPNPAPPAPAPPAPAPPAPAPPAPAPPAPAPPAPAPPAPASPAPAPPASPADQTTPPTGAGRRKREVADQRAWKIAREKASQVCPSKSCGQKDVASKCQCVPKAGLPWSHYCISMKARDPCCETWAIASCPEIPVF